MPTSSSRAAPELRADSVEPLLGYLLSLAEVSTRRVFQQAIGGPLDLRPVEFTLLALLHDNGQASARQIGRALRLPAPHVTTLVDRLAARGLLLRGPDPHDGRVVRVRLTGPGRALSARALRDAATMEDGLLSALAPAERRRLRALLLKLVRATAG
jgi:DNA-binding MarR family transcriptional regulator